MTRVSFLPRTVIMLGLVSFLNDAASDMITPILPLFLTAVLGAGPAIVGLIEGVAEATASILKLVAGRLVDGGWRPKPLIVAGYGLSNVVRPLIGLALGWGWVLVLRFFDRTGKGLRTSPRDVLVAAAVDQSIRGRAFGFHRAMDHAGAMLGPLVAFVLLDMGVGMRDIFIYSVVPGVLLMLLLISGVPGRPRSAVPRVAIPRLTWRALDNRVRALVLAAGGLAFASVPDAFLVLWASAMGMEIVWIPLLWAAAHAVRALIAGAGGMLSDRFGRLPIVVIGWSARVALLASLALAVDGEFLGWALFLGYAAATAFTEGAERALIGDFAPAAQKATAFGLYHMVSGLLALPGATLFGAIWQWVDMQTAFLTAAVLTAVSAGALLVLSRQPG